MVLFSERKRLAAIQAGEAEGESFWTTQVPQPARYKIAHQYEELHWELEPFPLAFDLEEEASRTFCRGLGLPMQRIGAVELANLEDADMFLSLVEAIHTTLVRDIQGGDQATRFADSVNRAFTEHRVAYKFEAEGSQVVELKSLELHHEVVEPVIRLLFGDRRLDSAQKAYMDALKQISQHDPANAITDAGTALQEALKALGVQGNVLGDQIKSARKKGLLPGRDSPLLDSVTKAMEWVASERNQNGDAHNVTGATQDDAWLIVHVVGALIVRLVGSPRV